MVSENSLQGGKLKKPELLKVLWNDNMFFDGRVAEFHGGVMAEQEHTGVLCQSMDAAVRAAHERDLVRRWYDGVVAARGGRPGEEIENYPFALAWRHYRRAAVVLVLFPVIGGASMDVANDRRVELVNVLIRRAFSAACHLDGDDILPS